MHQTEKMMYGISAFKKQFVLGSFGGVPVKADARWVLVIVLTSAAIALGLYARVNDPAACIVFGTAAAIVFFFSIFLHELAHALMARHEGLGVVAIILHPFGGLTQFAEEPRDARAEFRIAAVGPAASFVLAVIFALAGAGAYYAAADILATILFTLSAGNLLLAVFNMLPGYPLDGGRVLRAYLLRTGKDQAEATTRAAQFGKGIAYLLIFIGALLLVLVDVFAGLWAVLIGIFLLDSAKTAMRRADIVREITAGDVMRLPISVPPDITVQKFIDEILPMHRMEVFPVSGGGDLFGTLVLKELMKTGRGEWNELRIEDVMIPIRREHFVGQHTPLELVREVVRTNGIGAVSVVDSRGKLVGVLQTPLPH
jgi:Zn-dependent protease